MNTVKLELGVQVDKERGIAIITFGEYKWEYPIPVELIDASEEQIARIWHRAIKDQFNTSGWKLLESNIYPDEKN